MKALKAFLYLDEYKMYSLSSQMFSGLTEHILMHRENSEGQFEQQKGPWASGRILANIAMQKISTSEKRSLYDYAYTLFEKQLDEDKRILHIDDVIPARDKIQESSFIRVVGTAILADIEYLHALLKNFNKLGQAIAYVSKDTTDLTPEPTKPTSNLIKTRIKNLAEYAKQRGLQQDQQFLDQLAYLLTHGYGGLFQVRMTVSRPPERTLIFSANLNKEHLRESDRDIINKYGRKTDRRLTIFGIPVQASPSETITAMDVREPDVAADLHMKEAIFRMVDAADGMERSFLGRLPNEVILDPIAVYHEV